MYFTKSFSDILLLESPCPSVRPLVAKFRQHHIWPPPTGVFFQFFGEMLWIFQWNVLYFSVKYFGFLYDIFWWNDLYFWLNVFVFLGDFFWISWWFFFKSHGLSARRVWKMMSSRPDGPKAGPGPGSGLGVRAGPGLWAGGLEVGAQRAPRHLVKSYFLHFH